MAGVPQVAGPASSKTLLGLLGRPSTRWSFGLFFPIAATAALGRTELASAGAEPFQRTDVYAAASPNPNKTAQGNLCCTTWLQICAAGCVAKQIWAARANLFWVQCRAALGWNGLCGNRAEWRHEQPWTTVLLFTPDKFERRAAHSLLRSAARSFGACDPSPAARVGARGLELLESS